MRMAKKGWHEACARDGESSVLLVTCPSA